MKTTRIYFKAQFTGLHQGTTLLSIGLISDTGKTFYAEFNDYAENQVDKWIEENVISKMKWKGSLSTYILSTSVDYNVEMCHNTGNIKYHLQNWLTQFEHIEIWSDCLAYDWMLFCQIFKSPFNVPKSIYYIPFDLATAFKMKGIDPDISREKYAFGEVYTQMLIKKRNSLWDAEVIKLCYDKLMSSTPVNSAL